MLPAIFTWPSLSPVASDMEWTWSPRENVFAVPAAELVPTALAVVEKLPVVTAPPVPVITGRFAVVPILPSFVMLPCVWEAGVTPEMVTSVMPVT